MAFKNPVVSRDLGPTIQTKVSGIGNSANMGIIGRLQAQQDQNSQNNRQRRSL